MGRQGKTSDFLQWLQLSKRAITHVFAERPIRIYQVANTWTCYAEGTSGWFKRKLEESHRSLLGIQLSVNMNNARKRSRTIYHCGTLPSVRWQGMVVSQWKVNSASTTKLMMNFYQALESSISPFLRIGRNLLDAKSGHKNRCRIAQRINILILTQSLLQKFAGARAQGCYTPSLSSRDSGRIHCSVI